MPDRNVVRIEPWGEGDFWLLEQLVVDPVMMAPRPLRAGLDVAGG